MSKISKEAAVSYELALELLSYDKSTGLFQWLERPVTYFKDGNIGKETVCRLWNTRYAGTEALTHVTPYGYKHGRIFDVGYYAHRVAWLLTHKEWPIGDVDHIDGNKLNNTIDNLRVVSRSINNRNAFMQTNNTSGVTGVSFHTKTSKWRARLQIEGKEKHLGLFDSFDEAVQARLRAQIAHGFTERHGKERTYE